MMTSVSRLFFWAVMLGVAGMFLWIPESTSGHHYVYL